MNVARIAEILLNRQFGLIFRNNYEKLESNLIIKTKISHTIDEQNISLMYATHQKDSNST